MIVKMTYGDGGFIDVETMSCELTGAEASVLLDALKKLDPNVTVERWNADGKQFQVERFTQ